MKENPAWHKIHEKFKLNGVHYGYDELNEIGYSLIKEGEDFEIAIGDFLLDWISADSTVKVQTSGSTGNPKAILLQKSQMVNSAKATGSFFGITAENSALLCLSCTGIAGKMMLVRAMVLGLQLDYVRPSSKPLLGLEKSYDFVAMVPLQLQNSLNQLSQIKTLIVGGAPVSQVLKAQVTDLSTQIFETYGMTETITHVGVKSLTKNDQDVFEVLPEVQISQDKRGCLLIQAPKISDAPIITNDIVELIDSTSFKWLGRFDSIINSGGVKLHPEQIEQKLSEVIEQRFFVTGIPDKKLGQKLVLLVEDTHLDKSKIEEKIKNLTTLSKYEIPKEILTVEQFSDTKTGKILRKETVKKLA